MMDEIKVERAEECDFAFPIKVEKEEPEEEPDEPIVFHKKEQSTDRNVSEMVYFEITEIIKEENIEDNSVPDTGPSEETKFRCIYCDKIYSHKNSLGKHLDLTHRGFPKNYKRGSVQCNICEKTCKGLKTLKRHVEKDHPLPAEIQKHVNLRKIIGHDQKESKGLYECAHCGAKWKKFRGLRCHMVSHMTERLVNCQICSKTYKDKHGLDAHMRYTHRTAVFVQCPECFKTFRQHFLRRHLVIAHTEKTINCPCCPKKFSDRSHMKSHLKQVHGNDTFECQICHAKFNRLDALKIHKKEHEFHNENKVQEKKNPKHDDYEKRPYQCKICKRRFTSSENLETHGILHADTEPNFKCDQCPKAFKAKHQLGRHISYYHSGECPCKICGKILPGKSSLQCHMRSHRLVPSSNSLKCDQCRITFKEKEYFIKHLIRMHKMSRDAAKNLVKEKETNVKSEVTSPKTDVVTNKDSLGTEESITSIIVKEEYEVNYN